MIDDWFFRFIPEHRTRHPAMFLPDIEAEDGRTLYGAWRQAFVHRGVLDYDVATLASERLTGEAIERPRDHLPRLIDLAIEIHRTRAAAAHAGETPDTREAARLASRGCEHCGGEGQATAYHPAPSYERRIPASVGAHCVCPHGRWIRRRLAETDPEILRRIPDFADVLGRRSGWLAEPPDLSGVPAVEVHGPAPMRHRAKAKATTAEMTTESQPEPAEAP